MAVSRDQYLRRAAIVATFAFGSLSSPAYSQEWPARPLTMVVPTAAGGGAAHRLSGQ
jgi:tripartite-type tricarboxylate transporter receptor subunit TctC